MSIGSHLVTETAAPTGYAIDTASKSVTVTTAATCSSGTPAAVSFTDSPKANLVVKATSVIPGVTNTSIDCGSAGSVASGDPVELDANGLTPQTVTCTIVIDP